MWQKLKNLFTKSVFKFKINYRFLKPWSWNWQRIKEVLKISLLTLGVVLAFLLIYYSVTEDSTKMNADLAKSVSDQVNSHLDEKSTGNSGYVNDENCNVASISLHGSLVTYISNDTKNDKGNSIKDQTASDHIVSAINEVGKNDSIKAIILEIDSPGGMPVAGEEVANALKQAKKPTVAYIRSEGLSAAYWSATGANIIFASAVSDVGSIGVTSSYLDEYKRDLSDGLTLYLLSSGKFKDLGNPDKPLTADERALIMRDVNIGNQYFMQDVATNRNLDINKVKQLADGSSVTGQSALKDGLIDRIGGIYEVKNYVKGKIGEEPEICWY